VEQALAEMGPGLKGITVDANVHRPATFIETALKPKLRPVRGVIPFLNSD